MVESEAAGAILFSAPPAMTLASERLVFRIPPPIVPIPAPTKLAWPPATVDNCASASTEFPVPPAIVEPHALCANKIVSASANCGGGTVICDKVIESARNRGVPGSIRVARSTADDGKSGVIGNQIL